MNTTNQTENEVISCPVCKMDHEVGKHVRTDVVFHLGGLADIAIRLDEDGAFTGNPKYDAALKRLSETRLDDDELKRLYGSKWKNYRD